MSGVKRGPGRPPKKEPAPIVNHNGIATTPHDPQNRLELVFDEPMVLKNLFIYFKNLKSPFIHIRSKKDGLTLFARDAAETCCIIAELPGNELNHFYSDTEFWIGLQRTHVERIFASVDKSFYKVTLVLRHDDPDTLMIIFTDADIDKECQYRVNLSMVEIDKTLKETEQCISSLHLEKSIIVFSLSAKQFKKSITDASYYTDTITIEKMGLHNLQLTYTQVGVAYNEIYTNSKKIELQSRLTTNDSLRCTVGLDRMRSLAAAMVTDRIQIYCNPGSQIIFRCDVSALIVSTITYGLF